MKETIYLNGKEIQYVYSYKVGIDGYVSYGSFGKAVFETGVVEVQLGFDFGD